jgi:hypothetical protein
MSYEIRRLVGLAVIVGLVLAGLYAGYMWLFHGWAAGAASSRPAWNRAWSIRFFVAMCVCFALAIIVGIRGIWRRRTRPAG